MAIVLSALSHFSLSIAELSESTRRRAVVLPRQIAMYLAKQMTAASPQEIGQSSEENTTRRFCIRIVKIDEQCPFSKRQLH